MKILEVVFSFAKMVVLLLRALFVFCFLQNHEEDDV